MVKVVAIEPVNNYKPGDEFEVSEREAAQLIERGLAKAAPVPKNKMAIPSENKANPSPAAGGETKSSASRAAQVSRPATAKKSARGGARKKAGA